MLKGHWSSCALHSGPARWPRPCDCGGFTGGKAPGQGSSREGYSPAVVLRNAAQLWTARAVYLCENHAIPALIRLKAAMRSALRRRRNQCREGEVQRRGVPPCT